MADKVETREVPRDEKQLHEFSVSRLGVASKCGLAFKYQYVDKLPAPYDSAASMFGNVFHDGLQVWYGEGPRTPINEDYHREQSFLKIVHEQWQAKLPPGIWRHLQGLFDLDKELDAVEAAILLQRPELKGPRQTQAFLTSQAFKDHADAKEKLLEVMNKTDEIKWPKDEDPLKAYRKSMIIAKRIEREWKDLPRPLLVEMPFMLEFEGWILHGRIDQLREDDPNLDPRLLDVKTGRQPLSQMMAFLQAFIYYAAVEAMPDVPTTRDIDFALFRHVNPETGRTKVQEGRIDPDRHKALALRILHGRTRQVLAAQFEPSYGHWCNLCDFKDLCSQEINIWQGDGIVTGTEVKA